MRDKPEAKSKGALMQTTFACGRAATKSTAKSAMAIYHLSVKTISRSAGRSATAAAAYRAGIKITDERTGELHDYTSKGV
jgi:MobA/MobL family